MAAHGKTANWPQKQPLPTPANPCKYRPKLLFRLKRPLLYRLSYQPADRNETPVIVDRNPLPDSFNAPSKVTAGSCFPTPATGRTPRHPKKHSARQCHRPSRECKSSKQAQKVGTGARCRWTVQARDSPAARIDRPQPVTLFLGHTRSVWSRVEWCSGPSNAGFLRFLQGVFCSQTT
jgi:hypothetical protein